MSSSNIFDLITFPPKTSIASWFSSLDFLASQQPPHQLSLKGQHSKSNIFYPIKLVSNIFLSFVLPHHPHPPRTSCLHSSLLHQFSPRQDIPWLKTEGWSGNTKSNIFNPIKLVSNIFLSFVLSHHPHPPWTSCLHSSFLHQLSPRQDLPWLKTEGWSGNTKSNIINPIKLVSNIVFSFAHGYWRHFLHFIKLSAIYRRRNNTIS